MTVKKPAIVTLLVMVVLSFLAVWKQFIIRQPEINSKLPATVSVIQTPTVNPVEKSSNSLLQKQIIHTQPTFERVTFVRNTTPIDNDIDVAVVQKTASALVSGTEDEQIDAIKLFSKVGTEEQKTIIEGYARDTTKSIAIRLTAVEHMDWENNSDFLSNTINSATNQGNNGIAEAVLNMASDKELSQEAQKALNESAYSVFQETSRPSTQIAILNYFFEQHDARFDELSAQVSFDEYSPEEKEDVLSLINQRKEEVKPAIDPD